MYNLLFPLDFKIATCYFSSMNAKEFLVSTPKDRLLAVLQQAGTNLAYFRQIAYGHRLPSRDMAARLERASEGKLSRMQLLYPTDAEV
jgi:hypothetical protein